MTHLKKYHKDLTEASQNMRQLVHQMRDAPVLEMPKVKGEGTQTVVFSKQAVDHIAGAIEKYIGIVQVAGKVVEKLVETQDT